MARLTPSSLCRTRPPPLCVLGCGGLARIPSGWWRAVAVALITERRKSEEYQYELELLHEGTREVYGTLSATDTQLTIYDEGGGSFHPASVCTGRYGWQRKDKQLWISLIRDRCTVWRARNIKTTMVKSQLSTYAAGAVASSSAVSVQRPNIDAASLWRRGPPAEWDCQQGAG